MRKLLGPFRQIVTMRNLPFGGPIDDSQLELIVDGGIVSNNGTIESIGSYKELASDRSIPIDETTVCRTPTVAIPGLIDCHTHICFAGNRARDYALRLSGVTYQEIAARGGGILDTVSQTRKATTEELAEGIIQRAKQLASRGITTCEVKSGYGLSVEHELKMLQAIKLAAERSPIQLIPTCLAAHTKPPEFNSHKEYLDYLLRELLPIVKRDKLANRIDIFVEKEAFDPTIAKNYLLEAKRMGFELTIHADQFSAGGSALAAQVGARSAEHLEVSGFAEIEALRKGNVIPVVLPGATLGLGLPFAPARAFLDAQLPLAIASDWNPGSAPMGHLLLQAALLGTAEKLTMAETLAGITYRAANALGLKDRGTIAVGKRTDLTLFSTSDYREILYNQGMATITGIIIG
jgi:imidazolonepropionase